jgi:glucose-1-phosphate thymidylyltransferase
MILTPHSKLYIILTAIILLILAMIATPFLVTSGSAVASREVTQAFFLIIEFLGASFLLNEFNRLRIVIKEKEAASDQLTSIEKEIKKLSTFQSAATGMKGIVLAGGTATRLFPLTATTSKQLLPIYDKQMIFYPLNTLIKAGIRDILVIVSPDHSGQFLNLLGSIFKEHGVRIHFDVQKVPRGLADAFIMGESFIGDDNVALILGDNIFEDDVSEALQNFKEGAQMFAKKVPDPERFGVVKFNEKMKAEKIVEKPKTFLSDYASVGLYVFDKHVAAIAKKLKPSDRGEIEIVDLQNHYLKKGKLKVSVLDGAWLDAGTFDALLEASQIVKDRKIAENFHPIILRAISDFNEELKWRTKKVLEVHNLYLRTENGKKK